MRKKLIILFISIIGMLGLSSCDTLCYTTPIYYETYPTVVYRNYPPPPPPRHYYHKPHHKHNTPPPPPRQRGRHKKNRELNELPILVFIYSDLIKLSLM